MLTLTLMPEVEDLLRQTAADLDVTVDEAASLLLSTHLCPQD